MKVVDREEVVFNLISVNQSFVSVIAITLCRFSLKPQTFEASSTFFSQQIACTVTYLSKTDFACDVTRSKEVILQQKTVFLSNNRSR